MNLSLTTQPNRRHRRTPYQIVRHYDGSVEIIICHRGGVSRFFGDSEKETINRARSYEASIRPNEQTY